MTRPRIPTSCLSDTIDRSRRLGFPIRSGSGPSTASVSLKEDGSVGILTGSVDTPVTDTAFAQSTAEALRADLDKVTIAKRDTDLAPFTGPSGESDHLQPGQSRADLLVLCPGFRRLGRGSEGGQGDRHDQSDALRAGPGRRRGH